MRRRRPAPTGEARSSPPIATTVKPRRSWPRTETHTRLLCTIPIAAESPEKSNRRPARRRRPTMGWARIPASARPGRRRGSRKEATTTPAKITPALANCARDAMNESCLSPMAVDAAAPKRKSAAVTARPSRPSHGSVARSGANASTSAIDTDTLHTVCSVRTCMVHQTPMPSAGI